MSSKLTCKPQGYAAAMAQPRARAESNETVVSDDSGDEDEALRCPLTGNLFEAPVLLLQSGETYEAGALARALAREPGVDPKTGLRFSGAPATAPNKVVAQLVRARRRAGRAAAPAPAPVAYDARPAASAVRGLPPPRHHDRYRTKICRFGDRCPYLATNECQYLHPDANGVDAYTGVDVRAAAGGAAPPWAAAPKPASPATRSYKTKICRFGDDCPYLASNKCQFAHSVEELEHWKRVRSELPHVAGLMGYTLSQGERAPPAPAPAPAPRPFASAAVALPPWGGVESGPPLAGHVAPTGELFGPGEAAADPWHMSAAAGLDALLGAPDPVARTMSAPPLARAASAGALGQGGAVM